MHYTIASPINYFDGAYAHAIIPDPFPSSPATQKGLDSRLDIVHEEWSSRDLPQTNAVEWIENMTGKLATSCVVSSNSNNNWLMFFLCWGLLLSAKSCSGLTSGSFSFATITKH